MIKNAKRTRAAALLLAAATGAALLSGCTADVPAPVPGSGAVSPTQLPAEDTAEDLKENLTGTAPASNTAADLGRTVLATADEQGRPAKRVQASRQLRVVEKLSGVLAGTEAVSLYSFPSSALVVLTSTREGVAGAVTVRRSTTSGELVSMPVESTPELLATPGAMEDEPGTRGLYRAVVADAGIDSAPWSKDEAGAVMVTAALADRGTPDAVWLVIEGSDAVYRAVVENLPTK